MTAACRAFEQRLLAALDGEPDTASLTARACAKADAHAVACDDCAALAALVAGQADAFKFLARPAPSEAFLARLADEPDDAEGRQTTSEVLAFLTPGALAKPEPSPALLARLEALPRASAPAPAPSNVRRGAFGRLRPILTDWRFAVTAAYAASILVFALLNVDPMAAARGAATDLTAAGERALTDARVAAVKRVEDSALGRYAAPLTKRLDYRVYRAFAAGRARATAYSQLVFEKVFGGSVETMQSAAAPAPEPSPRIRRS
ncbi:MAG: hypothetical protein IPL89_03925 [Acidobacteria bacterium]|nr:hypothetical protein [Acidobacteriota bacterium]